MTSDLPTLYRLGTDDSDGYHEDDEPRTDVYDVYNTVGDFMGWLVPVTEPLLTREEAANAMMAFLNEHGGDVGQHWPTMEDALKWLGADRD